MIKIERVGHYYKIEISKKGLSLFKMYPIEGLFQSVRSIGYILHLNLCVVFFLF